MKKLQNSYKLILYSKNNNGTRWYDGSKPACAVFFCVVLKRLYPACEVA